VSYNCRKVKQATLLFLRDDTRILLAMKKRGYGIGRWNGVGGKLHKGETITEAAVRECQEEIGVTPVVIKETAILNFHSTKAQQVTVFMCEKWQGEPCETEEMAPKWFSVGSLPYSKMWPDDPHWLPRVINGTYVTADFYFDDEDNLLKYEVLP
jgi:mutator protein MutT